jgi:hypothetical protein
VYFGANFYNSPEKMYFVEYHLGKEDIDILDIKRIYRFLDKNVKKDDLIEDDVSVVSSN